MKTASIYKDLEFKESKPTISILFDTTFTKEIRIALKKGQAMKEHQSPYPIVVHILEGEIEFRLSQEVLMLEEGHLIALESAIPHSLLAHKDSIVRLTLSKADQVDRVQKVVGV